MVKKIFAIFLFVFSLFSASFARAESPWAVVVITNNQTIIKSLENFNPNAEMIIKEGNNNIIEFGLKVGEKIMPLATMAANSSLPELGLPYTAYMLLSVWQPGNESIVGTPREAGFPIGKPLYKITKSSMGLYFVDQIICGFSMCAKRSIDTDQVPNGVTLLSGYENVYTVPNNR